MSGITIRAATEADLAALERVLVEAFLADHTRYIPEAVDPRIVRAFGADLVGQRWAAMALAQVGGEPVGMLYVEGPRIEAINILPAFQRRGIGTALMDWAEPRMAAAGVMEGTLDTQEANAPARAFYAARGYRVVRCWLQSAFTKVPIPTVTMAKRL